MNAHPPSLLPSQQYLRWAGQPETSRGDRTLWLAVVVWMLLAAAVGVRTLLRPASHTVFLIFAASAAHWWSDQSLYQVDPILAAIVTHSVDRVPGE